MSLAGVVAPIASDGSAPMNAVEPATAPRPMPAFFRNAARVPGSTCSAASWIAPSRSTSSSVQRSDMLEPLSISAGDPGRRRRQGVIRNAYGCGSVREGIAPGARNVPRAMLAAITRALEERDQTQGHGARVASLAEPVAYRLGWESRRIDSLRDGAPLHDIGKIGVRREVLLKSGPLTLEELAEI